MTAQGLAFRDYRPEDRDTLLALLSKGRPANYLSEKRAVFDWQFFGNPALGEQSPFVIGTVGDEIVAAVGVPPVRVRFGGEPTWACWGVDMYVSDAHRGRGFGKALLAQIDNRAPVMLAYGISDMSDPILAKAGWELDASMVTMFYHANEVGLRGFAKNLLTRSSRTLRARRPSALADLCVGPAPAAHELDALWSRVADQYPNAVERSASYLAWRYGDAPVLRYRWVTARRDGELAGALVTRHHDEESLIADYLGPLDDPSLIGSLVEVACADLLTSGTRRVRCETNSPALLAELSGTGFVKFRTSSRLRIRTNLPPDPSASRQWFVMAGDSDGDLLVL